MRGGRVAQTQMANSSAAISAVISSFNEAELGTGQSHHWSNLGLRRKQLAQGA